MTPQQNLRLLCRLAWGCVVLMVAVTTLSALLRLSHSQPVCPEWPGCRAHPQATHTGSPAHSLASHEAITAARAAHRITATLVLLASLTLVAVCLAGRPRRPRVGALALRMLLVALALAALGVLTPGSSSPLVPLGNLLGGFLLLALAWRITRLLATAPERGAAGYTWLDHWIRGCASLWALQAGLGVLSGAGGGDTTAVAHVLLHLLLLPAIVFVAMAAWRQGLRTECTALLAVTAAQLLLGHLAAQQGALPALVLAHNLGAALGFALLFGLAARAPAHANERPGPAHASVQPPCSDEGDGHRTAVATLARAEAGKS